MTISLPFPAFVVLAENVIVTSASFGRAEIVALYPFPSAAILDVTFDVAVSLRSSGFNLLVGSAVPATCSVTESGTPLIFKEPETSSNPSGSVSAIVTFLAIPLLFFTFTVKFAVSPTSYSYLSTTLSIDNSPPFV